ncbi:ribosomal protein S12 methylthiotransferase accessory factor [Oxalobacteraceae bacterium GrIS 1.11]
MERLSDNARLAMVYQALVHRRHGIITTLLEETEHPAARGLFVFNALMVDLKALMIDPSRAGRKTVASDRAGLAGSGAAFDRASALWASFGEAIERYCAADYFDDQLCIASEAELGAAAVGLDQFILFAPDQYDAPDFEYARPDPALARAWCPAVDLSQMEAETYVPAQLVYLGMRVKHKHEIVAQSCSTGLACGMDEERAILSGLCEVIERDSFAALWQMRYQPRILRPTDECMARLLPGVRHALQESPLEMRLWDISSDIGLPVVLCLARSKTDGTMSVGASANLSVEQAINKAVVEALHGYVWGSSIRTAQTPLPEREAVKNPSDHFAYFLDPARHATLDFLFGNAEVILSSDPSLHQFDSRAQLVARLGAMGYRTLAVDVTTGDIATLGFYVVRVLVPGLQPLLFGDGLISHDERRLRRIAAFWGMASVPAPNPDPHPFP